MSVSYQTYGTINSGKILKFVLRVNFVLSFLSETKIKFVSFFVHFQNNLPSENKEGLMDYVL